MNDAVLERNNILADTYNCKITVEFTDPHADLENRVKNDALSGNVTYDIISTRHLVAGLAGRQRQPARLLFG